MRSKFVYPFKYVSSWGKNDEKKLAPKNSIYRKLNMKNISGEDHKHVQ